MAKMLSKLNFKDYNNELETVLEKKDFSLDVKNLLLSMLYKIEVGYKDYKLVKQDITDKEEFIESIIQTIDKKCNSIKFIKPEKNDKSNFKIENDQIICYQNELSLFEAILSLSEKNFKIDKEYLELSYPIYELLSNGYEKDKLEVMSDFDGWTWNPTKKDIYFYCYQILRLLIGNNFLYNWKKNMDKDYLTELRKYSENLYICILKIAIVLYKDKQKIMNTKKFLERELSKMDNKSEYLKEIFSKKKVLNNTIKNYDKIINDKEMLVQEFNDRNNKLSDEKKIFSLSDLAEILAEERERANNELKEVAAMAEPKNYIERAKKIKSKIHIITEAQNSNINNLKQELDEIFEYCFKYELERKETKKDILEMIYKYRYACYLNGEKKIINCNSIIEKACKLKVLTILNENIDYNANIINTILSNSIIELENIHLILYKNEKLEVEIYDGDTFDRKEIMDYQDGFKIKFGKKIKLVE